MTLELEVIFINRTARYSHRNVILTLKNPTEEKLLKIFNAIVNREDASTPGFQMEMGFLWKILNEKGKFYTGGYTQIGADQGWLAEWDVEKAYRDIISDIEDSSILPIKVITRNDRIEYENQCPYN